MRRVAVLRRLAVALLALGAALLAPAALASPCQSYVEGVPGIRYAALGPVTRLAAAEPEVTIRYVGHSTFRIETPAGASVATDYFGSDGPGGPPLAVTMNHAHTTHYTDYPSPEIRHVLRGWNPEGGPAIHDLELRDMRIRNLPTDIRSWGETGRDGNSIFVFEIGSLCIAHLGHLHHALTDNHYAVLGRMDVLMVPVDGSFTMEVAEMVAIAKRLRSSIVLPMHFFGRASLERFLSAMSEEFAIDLSAPAVLRVAADRLPARPTVIVMQPDYGRP
ncbi:MBL fold metallo-hydrolase [Paralimibaculum aggregatum]|uniref:MBL fold metallo-hydrolase n=1 Tax=Paralimibaculum aggregatum TaxID=3036245 RepID=A0ABQ6LJ61_9RHOB|nr:MBL fold metallo-hydrolase [Limibaculum sp. NKW23]GMG82194.1 MBL fold metallo-hydrolase [Limibaculum sp. NKW23]